MQKIRIKFLLSIMSIFISGVVLAQDKPLFPQPLAPELISPKKHRGTKEILNFYNNIIKDAKNLEEVYLRAGVPQLESTIDGSSSLKDSQAPERENTGPNHPRKVRWADAFRYQDYRLDSKKATLNSMFTKGPEETFVQAEPPAIIFASSPHAKYDALKGRDSKDLSDSELKVQVMVLDKFGVNGVPRYIFAELQNLGKPPMKITPIKNPQECIACHQNEGPIWRRAPYTNVENGENTTQYMLRFSEYKQMKRMCHELCQTKECRKTLLELAILRHTFSFRPLEDAIAQVLKASENLPKKFESKEKVVEVLELLKGSKDSKQIASLINDLEKEKFFSTFNIETLDLKLQLTQLNNKILYERKRIELVDKLKKNISKTYPVDRFAHPSSLLYSVPAMQIKKKSDNNKTFNHLYGKKNLKDYASNDLTHEEDLALVNPRDLDLEESPIDKASAAPEKKRPSINPIEPKQALHLLAIEGKYCFGLETEFTTVDHNTALEFLKDPRLDQLLANGFPQVSDLALLFNKSDYKLTPSDIKSCMDDKDPGVLPGTKLNPILDILKQPISSNEFDWKKTVQAKCIVCHGPDTKNGVILNINSIEKLKSYVPRKDGYGVRESILESRMPPAHFKPALTDNERKELLNILK